MKLFLYYNTQAGVGRGVRRAIADGICKREDVFITTKIAPFAGGNYRDLIRACNEELGLSYIDLMLVHQSGSGDQALYGAIEDAVDEGIVRSAGISNYYTPAEYDRMTKNVRIRPAVIQNENHLFYQNGNFQSYVAKDGVVIESYYPLGGRGHTKDSSESSGGPPAGGKIWQIACPDYPPLAARVRIHRDSGNR